MAVVEGTVPFLSAPGDEALRREVELALARRWVLAIEHTADPDPRCARWEPWGDPVLDAPDAAAALDEVKACRAAFPDRHVKLVALAAPRPGAAVRLALLVHRPRRPARRVRAAEAAVERSAP